MNSLDVMMITVSENGVEETAADKVKRILEEAKKSIATAEESIPVAVCSERKSPLCPLLTSVDSEGYMIEICCLGKGCGFWSEEMNKCGIPAIPEEVRSWRFFGCPRADVAEGREFGERKKDKKKR